MAEPAHRAEAPIEALEVGAFEVPTESPESDGTLEWNRTTLVVVEVVAGGQRGLGYTYSDAAAARVAKEVLFEAICGVDAMDVGSAWSRMVAAVRNLGVGGLCATAISAVDVALWDLKARLVGLPLVRLLGAVRPALPLYGSGGFTSYSVEQLVRQLSAWAEQGFSAVKMKVGRRPEADLERVRAVRRALGPRCELYVDANGAYRPSKALELAEPFVECGVRWLEEPVSSDDLRGLRWIRQRVPPLIEIAAGEYGFVPRDFERLLEAEAVDVLQADATRCLGISGLMRVSALAEGRFTPLSTHTAPALHLHPACALPGVRHAEYFFDHVRIEQLLFDGVPKPVRGCLEPDLTRPGHGLVLKRQDARRFAR